MATINLYRNVRARDLLDAFLVSAISSLLLLRFYLYITGYPQVGSGSFHIAHMLYGGLFMMAAIVLCLTFLGIRSRQLAAVIGGVGFGIFIDELGKFITEDNDYFFHPTVGIIYATFVMLYLTFNFLTRTQKLTPREYQINVLAELEEAVAQDFDRAERARVRDLLDESDQRDPITNLLRNLVAELELTSTYRQSRLQRMLKKIDRTYERFWELRGSHSLISLFFVLEIVVITVASLFTIYTNVDDVQALFSGTPSYGQELIVGQIAASIVAIGFVIYGLSVLHASRLAAFEQFRRATLINIYLTQFFVFVRIQFAALPGLILSVALLILISFVINQELRLGSKRHAHRKR